MRRIVLHRYMQFLQGAELQNGPNLEAWVASGATSGAGCHWNPEELSCGGDGTEATVSALHLEGLWRARKLSLSQDDVSNENRRNLLVTTSQDLLVYSRSTFTFVWAQSNTVRCMRKSQIILQSSSVEADFERDSFPPASQTQLESKHANPSQICRVQLTCALSFLSKSKGNCSGSLLREDKIPDFFFITMSAFPSDWGLQLFQNQNQILQSHLKTIILGQIPEGAECLQLPLHSWGTKCAQCCA